MKKLLQLVILSVLTVFACGCAQNYYNIPRATYEQKVRVLGVAPIFVDSESDIKHPDKDALVSILKDLNRNNEKELAARIKDTGVYFSVPFMEDDADKLFANLFFRRERREDGGVSYNKYFYKLPELKDYLSKNKLDAIMLVVISGLTKKDKLYSDNLLSYLESDYNYLIMTAQILDPEGNILWEYPNFHERINSFKPFFALQYADFAEAKANASDKIDVKFKTIPGISRAFAKSEESSLQKKVKVSTIYSDAFDNMVDILRPDRNLFGLGEEEKPDKAKPAAK